MEQKLLALIAIIMMLVTPTLQSSVHEATVVGSILSAPMITTCLALIMLLIAVMI
jgi:hypothetical protein